MKNHVQLSIVQRIKKFLHVDEECSASELYSRLREYRNQTHPDRFTEDKSKKQAEDKFKEAQKLLPELFQFIQNEALYRTPAELSLYKPVYDHVFTQASLDAAQKEIADLKRELEWRKREVERLTEQLGDNKKQEFDAERKRLEELYKPSRRSWASLGITLLLSGALTIMTKIEEVSSFLKKYSPVDETYLNKGTFIVFLIILALLIKRVTENTIMKRRVCEVCSAKAPVDFIKHIEQVSKSDTPEHFTEYQVFEFLHGSTRWWKRVLSALGFVHYQVETVDQLKDFFISNSLCKELISISYAEGLDRRFTIRKKRGDWDV